MFVKLALYILLSVVYSNAQGNHICECKTEEEAQQDKDLFSLLTKIDQLANAVPDDQAADYAVVPGNLVQLDCDCEEKSRKKRNVAEFKHPINVDERKDMEQEREKRYAVHPKFSIDLRCPLGTYWIAHAETCVPMNDFDDNDSEEK